MYDIIYVILNSKFKLKKANKKNYFYNEDGQVVATVDEKSITMFYDFPVGSREIWNHDGKVAISFVKDFNINGRISDIIFIDGLCGATNDVKVQKDYTIESIVNSEMKDIQEQLEFDRLPNDEIIGNCGTLESHNKVIDFDIFGLIHFGNCKRKINVISKKGQKDINYDEIYKYGEDYYTAGSSETREYVDSKQHQTIDEKDVQQNVQITYTPKFIRKKLGNQLSELYTSSEHRSLNSTRLLMIKKIKDFIPELKSTCNCASVYFDANKFVNSTYEFQQRKVDKRKKLSR